MPGGNAIVIANVRMDGAWLAGTGMAAKKAYTARAFDTAASGLLENTLPGGELAGLNFGGGRRISAAPSRPYRRRHWRERLRGQRGRDHRPEPASKPGTNPSG
jgi:Haem-degrading